MKKALLLHITLAVALFFSCSSAPKNTGDIANLRTHAEREITLGNTEAARGNFEAALSLLNEARRKAILADDFSLIIKSNLSLGNVLLTINRTDEAFARFDEAISLAEKMENRELLAIARVYRARGMLISKRASASVVMIEVNREAPNIKSDRLNIALTWQLGALCFIELGNFTQAEAALRQSLDIHLRIRYLEGASYDWYMIGFVRSMAGNATGALQALEESITIDRRIENSWGLASTWRAMGDIHRRAENNDKALECYRHSRAIFEAMGNIREAAEIDRRINGVMND